MHTLIIKDLAITAELDRHAMTAVRGGRGSPSYGSYLPSDWTSPSFSVTKNDFSFDATQSLGQSQNTLVNNGNNVAFASGISATVNPTQTGSNNINFSR